MAPQFQTETVETIEAWSVPTFGHSPSIMVAFSRANEEMSELIREASQPVPLPEKIVFEAADIVICLCRVAAMLNRPIHQIFNATQVAARPTNPLAAALAANGHLAIVMARVLDKNPTTERLTLGMACEYLDLIVKKLFELCVSLGAHLGQAISAKMVINRAREWRKIGEGIGRHVEASA